MNDAPLPSQKAVRLSHKSGAPVFTVHAYRRGDRDSHSYLVGVYSHPDAAKRAAEIEEEWRGGKYACEILGWSVDYGCEASIGAYEIIVPLTPDPRFQRNR